MALANAQYIHERTFVGIRMTIVDETVSRQCELIEYFVSKGFKHFASEPVFAPVKNSSQAGRITQVDLRTYIKEFVKAWYVAEKLGVMYINSFMMNFDEPVEYACRSCLPTPHLTTDGCVSACDLGYYSDTPLPDLIYGRYNETEDRIAYDQQAIAKLRSRKCANMRACSGCSIQRYCGGGCLGRAYHETRDFYGVIPEYCWATRYLATHLPMDRVRIEALHP
jgi:radical SAM protein with 4Fe4S-binding SPASM domain